ncbi:hypothetical protein D3C77_695910 [compost metagenome]
MPIQLGVHRHAIDPVAGVARGLAVLLQLQATRLGRSLGVEGGLLGVEALAVQVNAVGQL